MCNETMQEGGDLFPASSVSFFPFVGSIGQAGAGNLLETTACNGTIQGRRGLFPESRHKDPP